jgi:hypothetical protein
MILISSPQLSRRRGRKRKVPLPKGEVEKIVPLLQGEGEKDSSCPGGTGTLERKYVRRWFLGHGLVIDESNRGG